MRKMNFAIGTDMYHELEGDILGLLNEAFKRGHHVSWFDFEKVSKKNGIVYLPLRRVTKKAVLNKKRMVTGGPPMNTDAELMDLILIRKTPVQSLKTLNLLKEISGKVTILNNPHGILKYQSKKYLTTLKGITAETYYSKKTSALKKAIKKLGNCVVKKEIGFGGRSNYHIFLEDGKYYMESGMSKPKQINLDKFLRKVTKNQTEGAIVVKFLKRVGYGDKRILVVDGKIMGAFLRLPKSRKGWICNVSSGGSVHKTRLTKEEKRIVKIVVKKFGKDGPEILGIDTLENDNGKRLVSEVNASSVWGMTMIEQTYHTSVLKEVVDWLETKVSKTS